MDAHAGSGSSFQAYVFRKDYHKIDKYLQPIEHAPAVPATPQEPEMLTKPVLPTKHDAHSGRKHSRGEEAGPAEQTKAVQVPLSRYGRVLKSAKKQEKAADAASARPVRATRQATRQTL